MPADYFLDLIEVKATPADAPWEDDIPIRGGMAAPFILESGWSGPAGNYIEEWLIRAEGGRVVYRSRPRYINVRGLQSVTVHRDRVEGGFQMDPGSYEVVFIVEGYMMGAGTVAARAAEEQAA